MGEAKISILVAIACYVTWTYYISTSLVDKSLTSVQNGCPSLSFETTTEWHAGARIQLTLSSPVDSMIFHASNWRRISSGWKLQSEPLPLDSSTFIARPNQYVATTFDFIVEKMHWNSPLGTQLISIDLKNQTCQYLIRAQHRNLDDGNTMKNATSNLTMIPCSWTHARPMDVGYYHLCAINKNHAMMCWGQNGFGQSRYPLYTPFIQVAAYDYHTCGINSSGYASCWGANYSQYSNYSYSTAVVPQEPFATITTGGLHACAITLYGFLRCWGANDFNQSLPPPGQFLSVAAGFRHTCAISYPEQALVCWGNCDNGECDPPVTGSPFVQVSAGDRYTCALTVSNDAMCWGRDLLKYNFTQVPAGNYSFVAASKSGAFSCGLLLNGTAVCWGDKLASMGLPSNVQFSNLAVGTRQICGTTKGTSSTFPPGVLLCYGIVSSMAPTTGFRTLHKAYCFRAGTSPLVSDKLPFNATYAPNLLNTSDGTITFPPEQHEPETNTILTIESYQYRKVEASGNQYSCAISHVGQVYCWGMTNLGGNAALIKNAVDVTASLTYDLMCALRITGAVTCSALAIDSVGQFVSGAYAAPSDSFVSLSAKGRHSCSLKTNGHIKCWGFNEDGQLQVPDLTYLYVTTGGFHTCAITTNFEVICWGRDNVNQVSGVPVGTKHRYVSCGYQYCCAIRVNDLVDCWGSNDFGESMPPLGVPVMQIATGLSHTCVVTKSWAIRCWGSNSNGQLWAPDGLYYHVSAGTSHSCATAINGTIVCWGDVIRTQLTPNAILRQASAGLTPDQVVESIQSNNSLSRMRCSNLSWGIAYSTNLCANAKTFQGCLPPASYENASARCAALGGRLPTATESQSGMLKVALCDFSDGWTWTSTSCIVNGDGGYIIVSELTQRRKCVPETTSTAFPICVSEKEFTACSLGSRCSQVCLPLAGSQYGCTCNDGFTLESDGATCSPLIALHSSKTCKQFGRTLIPATDVCLQSSSCSRLMTYTNARSFCRSQGSRLPYRDEVVGRSALPLNCGSNHFWTNSACANGLAPGFVTTNSEIEICHDKDELAAVICIADPDVDECATGANSCSDKCWNTEGSYTCTCSDSLELVATPTGGTMCQPVARAVSNLSCKQLGWTDVQSDYPICSSTRAILSFLKCPGSVSYDDAIQYCAQRGARLPTLSELTSNLDVLSRKNECGYTQRLIWTSSTCSRDQEPIIGMTAAGAGPQLLDKLTCLTRDELAFPICVADKFVGGSCAEKGGLCSDGCADVADGFRCLCGPQQILASDGATCLNQPPLQSPMACDSLPTPWTTDDTTICAQTHGSSVSTCSGRLSITKAQAWCASMGARLPTIDELVSDITLASGCKYDYKEVWASSPCYNHNGTSLGNVVAGGSLAGMAYFPPTCPNISATTAYVRCVRDGGALRPRCSLGVCSQLCFNQGFGFACACRDGFVLQSDGTSCVPSSIYPLSTSSCSMLNWHTILNGTCTTPESNCKSKSGIPFDSANTSCIARGARLPTLEEVINGATLATTCGGNRIWTSSRCSYFEDINRIVDGFMTITSDSKQPVCLQLNATQTVSCIADDDRKIDCANKCDPSTQQCLLQPDNSATCVCKAGFAIDGNGDCWPTNMITSMNSCSDMCWRVTNGICSTQRLGSVSPSWIKSILLFLSKCIQGHFQQCMDTLPMNSAANLCQGQGTRLPTIYDIRHGLSPTFSCSNFNLKTQRLWTSTTCRNASTGLVGFVATGTSQWTGPAKEVCLPPTSAQLTQCVADNVVDPCRAGKHKCAQTCISNENSYACACQDGFRLGNDLTSGSCSVTTRPRSTAKCAESDGWITRGNLCVQAKVQRQYLDSNGVIVSASAAYVRTRFACSGPVSFAVASDLCASLNARLPTMNELTRNRVFNSGCPDDTDVWTSTSCRPAEGDIFSSSYRVKGAGYSLYSNYYPRTCVATTPSTLAHVRCVIDA